jgi:4-amino-4-deoxy-L-arabinose transferase-like glycosyltransferase
MNKKVFLLLIVAVALSIRLYAWATMEPSLKIVKSDDYRYDQIAMSMLHGEGFAKDGEPIAWRGPGYPFFLAGIYYVFGHNPDAVRVIQCILGALLCVLIYYIASGVFNEKVGVIASIMSAVYIPFIRYLYWAGPCFLFSESVFMFFVAVTIALLLRYERRMTIGSLIAVGIASAVTAMIKPAFLLFMPFLFFWIFAVRRHFWKAVRDYAAIVIVFIACVMPWTIRNYVVFREFIPISNESGDIFLEGNHPLAKGSNVWVGQEMDSDKELLQKYSASQIKNMKYTMGLRYLLENPRRIPYLFTKKLLVTWNFFGEDGRYNISYGLILMFGLWGLVRTLRRRELYVRASLLVLALVWVSALCMIFFGHPRYRYPAEPYVLVLAAYGFYEAFIASPKTFFSRGLGAGIIALNGVFYACGASLLSFLRRVVP